MPKKISKKIQQKPKFKLPAPSRQKMNPQERALARKQHSKLTALEKRVKHH
jgi:hypothetical protein